MLLRLVLVAHVLAGVAGLALAVPVLRAPKRRGGRHARLGRWYVATLAVMVGTALVLALQDPARLAGLLGIAVGTGLAGAVGFAAARRRPRLPGGWLLWHLNAMGSSVIAFVTAAAVTLTGGHPLAWVLPTVVGSPLIARRTAALARGRAARPRQRFSTST